MRPSVIALSTVAPAAQFHSHTTPAAYRPGMGASASSRTCADYVLEGHPGLVSLFVSAPMEARVARVMRRNNLSESDARSRIARVDKNRASYYRYFTDENWGQARNYDLCINSGNLDALGAVSVIKTFVEARQS